MKRPKVVRLRRTKFQELKRIFLRSKRADRKIAQKVLRILNENPPVIEFIRAMVEGRSMQEAYKKSFVHETT